VAAAALAPEGPGPEKLRGHRPLARKTAPQSSSRGGGGAKAAATASFWPAVSEDGN